MAGRRCTTARWATHPRRACRVLVKNGADRQLKDNNKRPPHTHTKRTRRTRSARASGAATLTSSSSGKEGGGGSHFHLIFLYNVIISLSLRE
jgi:hypothetical protein